MLSGMTEEYWQRTVKDLNMKIDNLEFERNIKQEEIERLNNIINELEKSIDNKLKEFENNKDYFIDEITMKDLKKELQRLKENK